MDGLRFRYPHVLAMLAISMAGHAQVGSTEAAGFNIRMIPPGLVAEVEKTPSILDAVGKAGGIFRCYVNGVRRLRPSSPASPGEASRWR
jgi:hypothetical protein